MFPKIKTVTRTKFGKLAIIAVIAIFIVGMSGFKANSTSGRGILSIEMVFVEGGTFTMGSPSGGYDNERPTRQVTLGSFNIGKYPVTQGQWEAVMDKNPSSFLNGDDYPVERVSWNEVQTFISKLNAATGKNYRLPTEAEWEYAARGGNRSREYVYSGGNNVDSVAWHSGNSGGRTRPVAAKAPNELGIFDMSGNVWEWCSDVYEIYPSVAQTDPQGPSDGKYRVYRGGGWGNAAGYCRITSRYFYVPSNRGYDIGFRLAE